MVVTVGASLTRVTAMPLVAAGPLPLPSFARNSTVLERAGLSLSLRNSIERSAVW